jgi:hypothetical protein
MTTGLILFGTVLIILAEVLHKSMYSEKDKLAAEKVTFLFLVFAVGYVGIGRFLTPVEELPYLISFAIMHIFGLLAWIGRKPN